MEGNVKKGSRFRWQTVLIFAAVLGVILALFIPFWRRFLPTDRNAVSRVVIDYRPELEMVAEGVLAGGEVPDKLPAGSIRDVQLIQGKDGGKYVTFMTGYGGFGSQTVYYGFYYSPAGLLDLVDGSAATVSDHVTGLKTVDGDNWFYTERIAGNWYYYEQHF